MKIACISTSTVPTITANSIQLMKACQGLAQNDHAVRLWIPGKGDIPWDDLAVQYGLSQRFEINWIRSFRSFKRYDFAWLTWQQIRAWKPDVIYTWFVPMATWAIWNKIPVVLEMHDLPSGKIGRKIFPQWIKAEGKKRTLFITQALREMIQATYQCDFKDGETLIAPNGVDLENYANLPSAPQARQMLELPQKPTVVYSGHFYPGRGMNLLCDLALVLPDLQFLWVGGSPDLVDFWKDRLRNFGIKNISLSGFVPNQNLPLYQAAGDVLVMPYDTVIAGSSGGDSARICSPMKMFDYLASGRVIVTSDIPVFHEVLNNENAIFCPPNNLDAWRKAIVLAVQDHDLAEKYSQQSRNDAMRYSWQERARCALMDMYDR